jgi:hypothetical protein
VIGKLTRALLTSVLLALIVLVGCGTDSAPSPSGIGKHLGERCQKTEDCASSLCVRVNQDGGICSQACSDDSSCPRGDNWGCAPAPAQSFSVCACVPLADKEICGDGLDNDCNGAADDCRYCDGERVANDDHGHCGACDNACRPDQACRAGGCACQDETSTECRGSCVQLQQDPQNCGECGKSCGPDQTCQSGQCACATGQSYCDGQGCFDFQTDADHCGDCDTACTEGRVCQGGSCACSDAARPDYCAGIGCLDLKTDAKHCGACDQACPDGQSCVEGACACATGRTDCDGACKDMQADAENCGACGNACAAPLTCIQGDCGCTGAGYSICGERCASLQTDPKNCGACGNACAAGETCSSGNCLCPSGLACGGVCMRESDDANCGACGKTCPSGQRCSGESCVCEGAGLTKCGEDCLDLSSDEQSCGACDEACNNGESCNFGACQCPGGTTYCGGADACISLTKDPQNCGACGEQCNPTEVCSAGKCACPAAGQIYCAALGACVDVLASTAHCGACATKCKATEICQNGFCDCSSYTEQYCASQSACTDTYSNDEHCGACDRACPAGTHCSFGSCLCATGQTLCDDDKCYDLSTNAAHCGTCGKTCDENQVCTAGKCSCPAPTVGTAVRLTKTALHETLPVAAFNGTNVGVLYLQSGTVPAPTNLRFALLKPDGSLISDAALTAFTNPDVGDTVLTAGGLTWTGTEFGLVYLKQKAFNTHQVLLQRLNANGASKAAAVVVGTASTNGTSPVAVGWSASYGGYAVAYRAAAGQVFRRVGALGTSLEAENIVSLAAVSGSNMQLVAAPDGTWGLNATGNLVWFNADGSSTLPSLPLAGDASLSHDGTAWLATFSDYDKRVLVQRGTAQNQAVLWTETYPQIFADHSSTLVGNDLAVLLGERDGQFGPASLLFQRFVIPAGTSTAFVAPTPPIEVLPSPTCFMGDQQPHNFALVATGASALLAVWADSRWGVASELYSAPIGIPACP